MSKSYVILQPHSLTNPSTRYRIVEHSKWLAYVNKEAQDIPVVSSHVKFADAEMARNVLNEKEDDE